ncbi:MAG TPA: anti-phage dCTP deaminase [Kofleriaceae bacterium]|nr:anti-phage dCTP deaminase [Kofleriaceae bacterium]
MLPDTAKLLCDPGSELVFGLVAPVGADLDVLEADLSNQLRQYGYTPISIRLSKLLKGVRELDVELKDAPEFDRLMSHMDGGNRLRAQAGSGEVLALWAMAEIKNQRVTGNPVRRRTAHILRSIKHPDEARALRAVYGPGFFLIGLSASTIQKKWSLRQKGLTEEQALAVIERDASEENTFGQQTRDAFDLADIYIRQQPERAKTTEQLERFLRLVFGAVVETPTPDEHAMFLAYASSLRSADLSRQVGAVVWKDGVGVVATGCNDVPAPGGGLYWGGTGDQRDHALGVDANELHRNQIADEVARHVAAELKLSEADQERIRQACGRTRLLDITEFGRPVHAEMDSLISCARAGIETIGATLFSTTFPCHNCAKHIVAAGVRRVVYIEPYEKSQAIQLHGDAIRFDDHGDRSDTGRDAKKVVFEPFVGVGPRRYFDLFSMKLSNGYPLKRKIAGRTATWDPNHHAVVRVPMLPTSYLERESQLIHAVAIEEPA